MLIQDITSVVAEKDSQIKSLEEKVEELKVYRPSLYQVVALLGVL